MTRFLQYVTVFFIICIDVYFMSGPYLHVAIKCAMLHPVHRMTDPGAGLPGRLHLPGGGARGLHLREHHPEGGVGGGGRQEVLPARSA